MKGAWQSATSFGDGFPRLLRSLGMTRASFLNDIAIQHRLYLPLLVDFLCGSRSRGGWLTVFCRHSPFVHIRFFGGVRPLSPVCGLCREKAHLPSQTRAQPRHKEKASLFPTRWQPNEQRYTSHRYTLGHNIPKIF